MAAARLNTNVRLALLYTMLLAVATNLLCNTPLAAFLLLVTHNATGVPQGSIRHEAGVDDNLAVGIVTGVQGLVNMVCAIPAGILADRCGRQLMLRAGAMIGWLCAGCWACCFLYIRVHFSVPILYYSLLGAAALHGVFVGTHSAPLEALFGDSIESGSRSKLCENWPPSAHRLACLDRAVNPWPRGDGVGVASTPVSTATPGECRCARPAAPSALPLASSSSSCVATRGASRSSPSCC